MTTIPEALRRLHAIFYSRPASVLTDAACALEDYASQVAQLRTENEMLRAVIARQASNEAMPKCKPEEVIGEREQCSAQK